MENIYKVVIIEDSEEDCKLLEDSLLEYGFFRIVGKLSSGFTAPAFIRDAQPDLLFMDVELPGVRGYEVLGKLHGLLTWDMEVVFYTAHPQYMIDAIRISAFDYLLKPFEKKDLDLIVNRFIQAKMECRSLSLRQLSPETQMAGDKATFTIQLPTGDIHMLRLTDIGYFRFNALRRCWEVFLYTQKPLVVRSSINAAQILSFSSQFVQIHKSYIVNIRYLAVIHGDVCIMFPPFNKEELPISSKYKKELQNNFIQF
ncbi:LytTR family DNA-binding domain-containing protein [Bacteroides helcogenes]|uniref:Two component transcriptional regulator, LytTR family n=1 Tax=Bacteroides helcogenes (strain ATCC 35417 / DSM 20613 / JCM 6297 / CCUG 15421 / P 36-108) TaxID=693979 RepID=E6STS7_BACT6|nr:LytTR family DNA-binding domain-containing protein [Bacteroides helcogenes]ADV42280.1 two component transcriptional regulator, LytTR family [Bacteroides helcogenes P 36-108]MDY5237266.1 LytTR family DNA-binding domain-containing protein [Bacteroides helcogenes]